MSLIVFVLAATGTVGAELDHNFIVFDSNLYLALLYLLGKCFLNTAEFLLSFKISILVARFF